jgi:hypothetical protein
MVEGGYKTTSTNFSMALYQVLHNARNKGEAFDVDVKTGNWVLSGGSDGFSCQGVFVECGRDWATFALFGKPALSLVNAAGISVTRSNLSVCKPCVVAGRTRSALYPSWLPHETHRCE